MLFHPMRWQSEENVGLAEAAEWARHFGQLEKEMDTLLAQLFGISGDTMSKWINPGRYVTGRELAEAGMAELIELDQVKRSSFMRLLTEGSSSNGAANHAAPRVSKSSAAN
jgi:hypothetical protein